MEYCSIEKWPLVYVKIDGVINSNFYENLKKIFDIIISLTINNKEKCELVLDFTDVYDYKYLYIYKIIRYFIKNENLLDNSIKYMKLILLKNWKSTMESLSNFKTSSKNEFVIEYK